MSVPSRTLPLTPAMRAALKSSAATGMRSAMVMLLGVMLLVYAIFGFVAIQDPTEGLPMLRIAAVFGPVFGGGMFLLFAYFVYRQHEAAGRALRAGNYTASEGRLRFTELRLDSVTRHNLFVNGIKLELDYAVVTDVPRLMATTAGTALYAASAKYLFAAWDQGGGLLYTAPGYDLASDPQVALPVGATIPARSVTTDERGFGARLIALCDRLTGSAGALAALGVALLALSVVINNIWVD